MASYYCLSNVSGRQLEAALTCARGIEPAVVENRYSLMYRRDELDELPLVQKLGLLYLAYSPLERGLLSRPLLGVGRRQVRKVCSPGGVELANLRAKRRSDSPRPAARGGKRRSRRVAPQPA